MVTLTIPILNWTDAAGGVTALIVGDSENAAAHAPTLAEAERALKELLEWRCENEPWNVHPDLQEPELFEVKVEVLPQYSDRRRMVPCPETFWLRVPCVTGMQENGMRTCTVPHLGLRFNCQDPAGLKSLVAHYVKESLQGLTPLGLAGRLPPRNCRLGSLVIRDSSLRTNAARPADRPEFKVLFAVADPLLHDLGRKRTASAAYGRDALSQALARKIGGDKASVLLVGETGVGKSTLLLDVVRRLSRENVPATTGEAEADGLGGYRFWRGNGARMVAGMPYLGEWQERCEAFVFQLGSMAGVFCAENLLELVQVGGEGPGDSVAAFLLPYLERGELRLVAEATPAEVQACRRLLPGLLDVFQVIEVPAFDEASAIDVLGRVANACAGSARFSVAPAVPALVYRLYKRFLPYTAFPGPAAAFVRGLFERRAPAQGAVVSAQDVLDRFSRRTGLPEIFLRDDLLMDEAEVRNRFTAKIMGQPAATTAAARLVTTIKAGLTDPQRPFGVLLFCGPTGVGKTALAASIAEYCFGTGSQKHRLVRLDMSEYSGWGAAYRLLNAGHGKPAAWIESVRRQPFCVVLLDEIEKAAPEVFDVLLGLLDEGRLTDRFGRRTDFRSAIVILTSNLGSGAGPGAGFVPETGPAYASEVQKFFRPEFFNRLDAVVTFQPLAPEVLRDIVRKELVEIGSREGLAAAGIRVDWSEDLVALLAREGYDHRFGARPLQRTIERLVVTPLARWKVAHPRARDRVLRFGIGADQIPAIVDAS